jgi:two-component system response regulator YesN
MLNVLVVDDDKLVRKGLISAMPWQNFAMQVVGEASNGEKAMEFLESHAVDLLLTDLAMPVMSGIELMRLVRKRFPHIHIVVLTIHQDFEYVQEALRLGAIDYIAKVQLEKERFEEVLGRISNRIREQKEAGGHEPSRLDSSLLTTDQGDTLIPLSESTSDKNSFYDPNTPAIEVSLQEADSYQQGTTEESIQMLKTQWSAYEWIRNDLLYENMVESLKKLRLPQAKLLGLLYVLTDGWNRLFFPVTRMQIAMPDFDYWYQVEAWLSSIRDTIRNAMEKHSFSQEVTDCIMEAVSLIQEEMQQQITAADLALRVNMSRSYFSQCFKEIVGRTFNEYVRHARVEKAKEYLLYTNKTILWIAENTGYMDEKYFSRTFREHAGMLPSEYRQKKRMGREMSSK